MERSELKNILIHVIIGLAMYNFKFLGDVYLLAIITYFIYKAFTSHKSNKSLMLLYGCGYIVCVEVLLRMTGVAIFYEASKYTVILFSLIGIFSKGINYKSFSYVLYLLLLIPGIYITLYMFDYGLNIRKAIAFNLSGPFCLGISAIFVYGLKVNKNQILQLLNYSLYPLISILTYLFFYNPNVSTVITGTGSNFAASGGFGPNQVATVLGIGMFISSVKYFYFSKTQIAKLIDLGLLSLFAFRAVVTFSRGGVFTAVIMIVVFLFFLYLKSEGKQKRKIMFSVLIFSLIASLTWFITTVQTNGFIEKRYANENARGIKKEDITTGRTDLFEFELNRFIENPLFGIGVGRVKQLRFEAYGLHAASHNEMSRIIAEHGSFGLLAFSILLFVPLLFHLRNRKNIFFYPFYIFWLLTINHSSMRIAAPAFIYALSLLYYIDEKPIIHRKQVIEAK